MWRHIPDDEPVLDDDQFQRRIEKARRYLGRDECQLCSFFAAERMYGDRAATMTIEYAPRHESHGEYRYVTGLPSACINWVEETNNTKDGYEDSFAIEFEGHEEYSGVKARNMSATKINYAVLTGWLDQCHSLHSCTPRSSRDIPGLRLIDCQTRFVIDAPSNECQYAVLSYVWGGTAMAQACPTEYPATIDDAITVCVSLRLRYLWVDQYVRTLLTTTYMQEKHH